MEVRKVTALARRNVSDANYGSASYMEPVAEDVADCVSGKATAVPGPAVEPLPQMGCSPRHTAPLHNVQQPTASHASIHGSVPRHEQPGQGQVSSGDAQGSISTLYGMLLGGAFGMVMRSAPLAPTRGVVLRYLSSLSWDLLHAGRVARALHWMLSGQPGHGLSPHEVPCPRITMSVLTDCGAQVMQHWDTIEALLLAVVVGVPLMVTAVAFMPRAVWIPALGAAAAASAMTPGVQTMAFEAGALGVEVARSMAANGLDGTLWGQWMRANKGGVNMVAQVKLDVMAISRLSVHY